MYVMLCSDSGQGERETADGGISAYVALFSAEREGQIFNYIHIFYFHFHRTSPGRLWTAWTSMTSPRVGWTPLLPSSSRRGTWHSQLLPCN